MIRTIKWIAIIVGGVTLIFIGSTIFWITAHSIPWEVDEVVVDDMHRVVLYGRSNLDLNYDMYYKVFRNSRKVFESETLFCKHVYEDKAEDYDFYTTDSGVVGIYSSASPNELVCIMDLQTYRFPTRSDQTLAHELLDVLNKEHTLKLTLDDFHFPWQRDSK